MCLKERGGGARRVESSRTGAEGGHPGGFAYSLASPDLNNEAVGTSLRPMAETYVRATTKVSRDSSRKRTPEIPLHRDCLQPGSSFMRSLCLLQHPPGKDVLLTCERKYQSSCQTQGYWLSSERENPGPDFCELLGRSDSRPPTHPANIVLSKLEMHL